MLLYRGITRQEAERAGIALPKREYACHCGYRDEHDKMHHHQLDTCPQRPGTLVKPPSR